MLKRFFVGLLLLLVLTAALFTWQLPRVVTSFVVPIIASTLEDVGLSDVEISIDSIGVNQAYIGSLRFRYDDSINVIGLAEGIRITWTGMEILNGQATSINIDSLNLELDQDGPIEIRPNSEEEILDTVGTVLAVLEKPLAERVPFEELIIRDLSVYESIAQGSKSQLMKGDLALKVVSGDIALAASYSSDTTSEIDIELTHSLSGEHVGNVKTADGAELLALNIGHADQQLRIDGVAYQAIFEHIKIPFLEGLNDFKVSPIHFEGDIVRQVKSVSETQSVTADFVININDINSLDYSLGNVLSHFTITDLDTGSMYFNVDGETTVDLVEIDEMSLHGLAIAHELQVRSRSGGGFSLGLALEELSVLDSVSASQVSIDLVGELEIADQIGAVISKFSIAAEQPGIPISSGTSVTARSIDVVVTENSESQKIRFHDGWLRSDTEIVVDLAGLDLGDNMLPLDVELSIDELAYPLLEQGARFIKGGIYTKQAVVQGQKIPLTYGDIEQDFRLSGDSLYVKGTLEDTERSIGISSDTNYDLASGDLTSSLQVEKVVIDSVDLLASIFDASDLPLAIVTGQVESSFDLEWNIGQPLSELSVIGQIDLTSIGGAYDDYFFSGLNSSFRGTVYPRLVSNDESIVTVEQIDVGLAIQDIKGVLSFNQMQAEEGIEITLFSILGSTMGGYIAIRPVMINTANTQHELSMLIIGVDIETLLREQAIEDVIASGRLSGEVPILISDEGLSVHGGRVYAAEPGGIIQYKGDIEALSVAAGPAGFVFEALQDFNYGSMNIFPEYAPDGTLTMRLEVRGHNAQVEQGRPINFNINLEQNLLKLRESLRYADGLNNEIDEKVQAFYRDRSGQ